MGDCVMVDKGKRFDDKCFEDLELEFDAELAKADDDSTKKATDAELEELKGKTQTDSADGKKKMKDGESKEDLIAAAEAKGFTIPLECSGESSTPSDADDDADGPSDTDDHSGHDHGHGEGPDRRLGFLDRRLEGHSSPAKA